MRRGILICALVIGVAHAVLVAWVLATVRVVDDPEPKRFEVRL